MLKQFFVISVVAAFGCFLYGVFNVHLEVEPNACRMTYMFQTPQFSRVKFKENLGFPSYGLYYYNEGPFPKDVTTLHFNGAPVLFIPGNAGSYKQVRSLASVALRKAMHNEHKIHLDYFTIDYDEELSGLYGGYLERQATFLIHCVKAVLSLYRNAPTADRQIILIGHSMGGKVAQAVLAEHDISNVINTIIYISSPLDNPVMNVDAAINAFYVRTNAYLSEHRIAFRPNSSTNVCGSLMNSQIGHRPRTDVSAMLENVLLISIGGGNRDLLVRAALTNSDFSDIHAMTSAIPKVWLSCDHLSAVWCLQLVLAISRFLFSISTKDAQGYVYFNKDKESRLQIASHYFVKPRMRTITKDVNILSKYTNKNSVWQEDSRRIYKKSRNGLRQNYMQLIPLAKFEQFKKLYIEVVNLSEDDSLYGCASKITPNGTIFCETGILLSQHFQDVPSKDSIRSVATLDLHNIKKTYPDWSHVVLAVHSTTKPVNFKVDVHNPAERYLYMKAPRYFAINKKLLLKETKQGAVYYKIFIQDLKESFQAIEMIIEPAACMGDTHVMSTKICTPWAPGFNTYRAYSGNITPVHVYVNVPTSSPAGYNATKNAVVMELFLDPTCRYSINYKFSIADSMSRIVEQFYHWLPAHLTAALFIVLKNQVLQLHEKSDAKLIKPYNGFFQFTSLYIITACRILKKLLMPVKFLPPSDIPNYSIFVGLIVQSVAIMISIFFCFGVWALLAFYGNIIAKLLYRVIRMPLAAHSILEKLITNLPMSFGVLVIALAIRTCGGIALVVACLVYLMLLSNAYKDYVENWMWELAIKSFRKLRKRTINTTLATTANRVSANNAATSGSSVSKHTTNDLIQCESMQNFSFHIALFVLLAILTLLNTTTTIAWVKNYKIGNPLPDPSLTPIVIVLGTLSLLWQLEAPIKCSSYRFGYCTTAVLLYMCSTACILYCQESVYRLNFIIAFVFVLLLVQELLCRLWRKRIANN